MTDTATVRSDQAGAQAVHPLNPVSAAEFRAGRDVLAAAGLLGEAVRFAYYGLDEPHKDQVLAGLAPDRRLRAFLIYLLPGNCYRWPDAGRKWPGWSGI